jgi:hypothetical protein
MPIMDVIDIIPREEEDFWEIYWIAQFKAWGFSLLNHTNGGHNPPIVRKFGKDNNFHIPEVKKKIDEMNRARRGKTYEEIYGNKKAKELKKIIKDRTGGKNNPMYGKSQSEETKNKISKANLGENNGMYGKQLSADHIEKLREINKNKIVSDETKEKLRTFRLGKKLSEET